MEAAPAVGSTAVKAASRTFRGKFLNSFGEGETKVNIKLTLKASVAAAALFAVAVPVAEAGTIGNSNDMSVTVSGHMNKMGVYYDSGSQSGLYQADNGGSQTRARIVFKGKVNEAVDVTGVSEWAMTASNESSLDPADGVGATGINGTEAGTDSFFTVRHNYLKLNHKQFGALSIGHTSEATDGITENGGSGNLQYGTGMLFAASVTLENSATGAKVTGTDVGSLGVAVDGTRSSVFKYNTPSFQGVTLGVSHTNEQNSAVDAKFSGKFADFSVKAGIGYKNTAASSANDYQMGGGIVVGHTSGLAADFNYGKIDIKAAGARTPTAYSVGLNYAADLTSAGKTTFRIARSEAEDGSATGDELVGYMVGVDQGIAAGMQIYAGAQVHQADQAAGVSYEDVTTVFAGTKIVF